MRSRLFPALLLMVCAVPAAAQDRLSLPDAVSKALTQNPIVRSSTAEVGEAAERTTQARAGYLPRVSLIETAQRGNEPVFAFSSLLSARQFTAADFAIDSLNHPDPITSHHMTVSVEQSVFDGLRTRTASRTADLDRQIAESRRQQANDDLVLEVTRAYAQVLLASAVQKAADSAVRSAEEDVRRAEHNRDAGMTTEADVLALKVHLAQMQERQIRATSDETIARAELNDAMGEPLERQYVLDEVTASASALPPRRDMEQQALTARTELRSVRLQEQIARETRSAAKAAFFPEVSLQGYFNLNGTGNLFSSRASAWMVGAQVRWNVFSGLADVARYRETGLAAERLAAERERAESAVRLDVRTASARVQSAAARQQVGRASVEQARESQRIIRDRYEAGMASVNDVLRAANALLEAESQQIAATVDLLVSNATLERALGHSPASSPK